MSSFATRPVNYRPHIHWIAGAILSLGVMVGAEGRQEVCKLADKQEISSLFDKWNAALVAGVAANVVDLYADDSVLLPTLSNDPRFTRAEKIDYFNHFLMKKPVGHISTTWIDIECNTAIDTGLYSFTLGDGSVVRARYTFTYRWRHHQWKITSHHSSRMPE